MEIIKNLFLENTEKMELFFLVDSMLGNVGKKLQLLEYDTDYNLNHK